ncbi:hypothetical protein CJO71_20040 [Burkholderia ubonensis]|uniref:Uncharacterized protein n=1 Tax=Burkholderia ubonensis TaxID=101571 RepID=A0AB74D017_9BURK|nr:hypothetical protein [Burkholderia ubonensis]PAJ79170.1 hypothetical protein CJO71_20040 [Burkholderia ubonensis]PAJ98580.1 hypothetical protein CJO68_24105 [Burkholderia ubonensis]RQP69993.1 hypothetical protein DF015_31060 [Burkholderia ubonensis]RQP84641.1 hypothetical protein DF012_33900 [Burkholderia ubonensis]
MNRLDLTALIMKSVPSGWPGIGTVASLNIALLVGSAAARQQHCSTWGQSSACSIDRALDA